jgi:hypothetical protein
VRRYLAAFGPASLSDISRFAGQAPPRIRPTLERLAPALRRFIDEQKRTLFDLPRAPRPPGDISAPVRFLPRYDELLVGYERRDRVIAAKHRPAIFSKNGIVEATVLVDGIVAGTWGMVRSKDQAVLGVRPFAKLAPKNRAAVIHEGERLARFLAPDAKTTGVRVA